MRHKMRHQIHLLQIAIISIGAWVGFFTTENMPLFLPFAIFTTLLTIGYIIILYFKE